MKIESSSLQNYTPTTHTRQKFPAGQNWYKQNVDSLAAGTGGWKKIDLSPTLNLEELQKSADGPPGWKYLAIKQSGKTTIVCKNAAGKLEISKETDGYEPMSGPAHIPEIRAQLASGRATAWRRNAATTGQKSADEMDKQIDSLRKDVDVLDKDIAAYHTAAKSARKFLNTQVHTLTEMRNDVRSRIERLETLRDAARAREKPAAQEIAPTAQLAAPIERVELKAPAKPAAPLHLHEPDLFHESDVSADRASAIKSYLDSASDFVVTYLSEKAREALSTPGGQTAYRQARSTLQTTHASLQLKKSDAGLPHAMTADLNFIESELKELDAVAEKKRTAYA